MAGLLSKRHRDEEPKMEEEIKELLGDHDEDHQLKRHKSYNQILSLLEEEEEQQEEEEPIEDLSSIFTTLQQEISCPNYVKQEITTESVISSCSKLDDDEEEEEGEEEEERERMMRHLVEASDDELGIIPNNGEFNLVVGDIDYDYGRVDIGGGGGGGVGSCLCDHGLWELEDEAANYYTLFHSHLFM